jgi:hypothetical protein
MYDSNLQQFGLTHPELTGDALKKAYNDYFNQTVYPAATTAADLISDPTKLQGGAVAGNPNNEAYTKLVESATPSSSFTMGYKMEKGDRKFTGSKPADGSIIKDSKGRVWMGTASSGTDVYDGKDTDWIEMRDVNSGAVVRIWANHGLNEQLISSNITPPETVNTGSGGSINLNGSSN